jgi:hypothetical protein
MMYELRHRWRDGRTHVVFEPLELLEKLAALIPPPRFNLVRYHGVLAPGARRRAEVVPSDSGAEDLQITDVRIAGVHNLDPFALGITHGLSRWPVSLSSTS